MKMQYISRTDQRVIGKSKWIAWRTCAAPLAATAGAQVAGDIRAPRRRISAALTIAAALAVGSSLHAAAPIIPTAIEHGAATFATHGPLTTITAANRTIIDYSRFNIPNGDTVRFIQPNSTATVLNRINSAVPSQIDGNLFANGIVYLVNPAGVMFGADSVVDVGQLYAAASHITNQNFLSSTNEFTGGNGLVDNQGVIQASAVNFIGRQVSNEGTILAPEGTVALAAGNDVYLGRQDGNVYVELKDQPATSASQKAGVGVSNAGTIEASGGSVNLTAGDMYSIAARESGTITAANITVQGEPNSTVLVSGKLDASNQGPNQTGGTVNIGGGQIGIGVGQDASGNFTTPGATINASGANGGGNILIGVKPSSTSPTGYADAANYDFISGNSTLNASATIDGNGGFIDTSGSTMQIDLGANILIAPTSTRRPGTWLIDPSQLILSDIFTSDPGLNTSLWQVNGPAATAFEVGLSSPPNSVITPDITFSSTSGMQVSGVNGTYQAAAIQSVQSLTSPFTVTATVTGIEANANPFVLGVTNSTASPNIEIAGNLNPQNGNYYGIWGGVANGAGALQTDMVANPAINIPYQLAISVTQGGAASLSVSSGGTVLGTATGTVGTGPFYVILGQWEGLPYTVGPNIADWQSIQVTAGVTGASGGEYIGKIETFDPAPMVAPQLIQFGTLQHVQPGSVNYPPHALDETMTNQQMLASEETWTVGGYLAGVNNEFHPLSLPTGLTPIASAQLLTSVEFNDILIGAVGGAVQYEGLGNTEKLIQQSSGQLAKYIPSVNIALGTPDVWKGLVLAYELGSWDLAYSHYYVWVDQTGDIYAEAVTGNLQVGYTSTGTYFEIPASYLQNLGALPWDAIP